MSKLGTAIALLFALATAASAQQSTFHDRALRPAPTATA